VSTRHRCLMGRIGEAVGEPQGPNLCIGIAGTVGGNADNRRFSIVAAAAAPSALPPLGSAGRERKPETRGAAHGCGVPRLNQRVLRRHCSSAPARRRTAKAVISATSTRRARLDERDRHLAGPAATEWAEQRPARLPARPPLARVSSTVSSGSSRMRQQRRCRRRDCVEPKGVIRRRVATAALRDAACNSDGRGNRPRQSLLARDRVSGPPRLSGQRPRCRMRRPASVDLPSVLTRSHKFVRFDAL
jgi:hypothetical protein